MDFCAIISEFNPFHNGHEYLIDQAKQITNLPLVCLMSGNFVQRGEPAIVDKFERAKCAIACGADIVLELPTIYALSNAQMFAYGAIKTLKELGCHHIAIGVTHTDIQDYYKIANIKNANIQSAIAQQLENGTNYSKALINVLKTNYKNSDKIFTDASNILALEYIKQIIEQKANINVILVKRTDNGYNSTASTNNFANATSLRKIIKDNNLELCSKYIPKCCLQQTLNLPNTDIINSIVLYNLRNKTAEQLQSYYDYTEGLPYLISSSACKANNLEQAINLATTKRYRTARIKKLCLYPSLNITKSNVQKIIKGKSACKLLAIKKDQKQFISLFNKKYIKVIVSNTDYKKLTKSQSLSTNIDLQSSNLYALANGKPNNADILTGTLFID